MSTWSVSVPAGQTDWLEYRCWATSSAVTSTRASSPTRTSTSCNTLTDLSKSALRGVPDYTSPLYSNPAQWYPDPALATGGQTYNVFNLDPFVWFVHEKLGLTAYAFALDDDIGNVNAGGATNVAIAVGGLGARTTDSRNKDPYTNVSPFGVVTTTASTSPADSSVLGGLANRAGRLPDLRVSTTTQDTPGTLVNGPGVPTGTTVQFLSINSQTPSQSKITLSNPLTSCPRRDTYSFFGPLTFTGDGARHAGQATTTRSSSPARTPTTRWRSSARSRTSRSPARASIRRRRSRSRI